jgi:hypothetical protein
VTPAAAGRAANIGPKERRLRLVIGVVMLLVAFAGLVGLIRLGVHPAWRVVLFLPFWLAALGYLQARERT